MLNKDVLEKQLLRCFNQYIPLAFSEAIKTIMPSTSEISDDMAQKFGDAVNDMLSEPLASSIASCIDLYVKNISLTGQIITTTGPVSIIPATPLEAGIAPNTLKVL